MHARRLLKTREGFTLAEVLVALTITAIIGAAVTGVFVTQSRFFDHQEKTSFARGVSRSAMNILMSELRMLERAGAVESASATRITIRAPYALGVSCGESGGGLVISQIPADTVMIKLAGYSGYAFRRANGLYEYNPKSGGDPTNIGAAQCTAQRVRVVPSDSGGRVLRLLPPDAAARPGSAVLLYQRITYEFKASTMVPGRIALWRTVEDASPVRAEELVAPFDTTARFRFYVNDAATPVNNAPGSLSSLTGIQLVLNGLSDRPGLDGKMQSVQVETSVFFRNR